MNIILFMIMMSTDVTSHQAKVEIPAQMQDCRRCQDLVLFITAICALEPDAQVCVDRNWWRVVDCVEQCRCNSGPWSCEDPNR